ncbi:hypothetical protein [Gelidibacter japonicus]|uniref:hypothetical protein n=1 Tax=Gelidibacter japonicus TaxID=1962232 RepID=UPI003A9007FB
MSNYWNISGVPHKGWILEEVYDIRAEGQSADETQYETCMMCNNERIRYVHVVSHRDFGEEFKVGCVCAEKMTNDYVNPKKHEKQLINKSQMRIKWLKKEWKISKKGNSYLKITDHLIVIYQDRYTKKFKINIGDVLGTKQFEDIDQAKMAAFNGVEYMKEKDLW